MAPEFSPDGTSYHLSFVAKYARAHGFVRIPTNIYAQLSQGIELLFLMAFTFGRHSSSALVHYAFLLALTLAVVNYGRRSGYPVAGLAGALLVYASPVVGIDAASAYIDVAVACILFAVFYLLRLWDEQRSMGLLLLAGLLAGFGYAAKYTAGLAIPYAAGYVLWRTRRVKPAFVDLGVRAVVMVAPWVIKNLLWAGNPVAPMFNRLFPNPYVHVAFESGWTASLTRYDLPTRWAIPLEVTVRGERLGGLLGPVLLLLPLCLFALRLAEGRRMLAAAALFTLPYFANIGTRFLIPALPFYAFSLALVLTEMQVALVAVVALHCILSWPSIASLYSAPHPWMLGRIPLRQALRIESEDSWLSRKQPDYPIARLIERQVQPHERVLAMSGVPESYTTRDVLVSFQSAAGDGGRDIFYSAYTADYQPRCGERFQFPRRRRYAGSDSSRPIRASGFSSGASPNYDCRGRNRTRAPSRVENHCASESVGDPTGLRQQPRDALAFAATIRARHVGRGRPRRGTESGHGPSREPSRLRGSHPAPGRDGPQREMDHVSASAQIVPLTPPPFMGKAAMRELKLRGIDYLLLRETDFGYPEVQENPAAWGLTEVGKASNAHLYRLDAGYPVLEDERHDTIISGR